MVTKEERVQRQIGQAEAYRNAANVCFDAAHGLQRRAPEEHLTITAIRRMGIIYQNLFIELRQWLGEDFKP